MTQDHKRHGTTTLFAALNVLSGAVIGQCLPRHRHEEFLTFLRRIEREVARPLQDEAKRAEVTAKIQGMFAATEADVKKILDGLDPKVDAAFTSDEAAARQAFEDVVADAEGGGVPAQPPGRRPRDAAGPRRRLPASTSARAIGPR